MSPIPHSRLINSGPRVQKLLRHAAQQFLDRTKSYSDQKPEARQAYCLAASKLRELKRYRGVWPAERYARLYLETARRYAAMRARQSRSDSKCSAPVSFSMGQRAHIGNQAHDSHGSHQRRIWPLRKRQRRKWVKHHRRHRGLILVQLESTPNKNDGLAAVWFHPHLRM